MRSGSQVVAKRLFVSAAMALSPLLTGADANVQSSAGSPAISTFPTGKTCQEVDAIKFDRNAYMKLTPQEAVVVDAQWQKCDMARRAQSGESQDSTVVVLANPVATNEGDKVFYGLVKRKDLEEADKLCKGSGKAAGVALIVYGTATANPGASELGGSVFEYSGVSCGSISGAISDANLLAVIAPNSIISSAVAGKVAGDILKQIPVLSDADKKKVGEVLRKATRPPEVKVGRHGGRIGIKGGPGVSW